MAICHPPVQPPHGPSTGSHSVLSKSTTAVHRFARMHRSPTMPRPGLGLTLSDLMRALRVLSQPEAAPRNRKVRQKIATSLSNTAIHEPDICRLSHTACFMLGQILLMRYGAQYRLSLALGISNSPLLSIFPVPVVCGKGTV